MFNLNTLQGNRKSIHINPRPFMLIMYKQIVLISLLILTQFGLRRFSTKLVFFFKNYDLIVRIDVSLTCRPYA